MSYTRQQWAVAFLNAIGNNNPSQNVIDWVVNWTRFETATGSGASYNLLNTTQPESGSTVFNSVGVQNYTSFQQGVQANASTLENGYYPSLLSALQSNNEGALGFNGSPSQSVLSNLSTWCGGCGYGNQFASNPGQGLSDSFPGVYSGNSPTSPTTSSSMGSPILGALGLPTPQSVANAFQSIGIFLFGGILILMGVIVLFVHEETK